MVKVPLVTRVNHGKVTFEDWTVRKLESQEQNIF